MKKLAILPASKEHDNNLLFNISCMNDILVQAHIDLVNQIKDDYEVTTLDTVEDYSQLDVVFLYRIEYKYLVKLLKSKKLAKTVYFAWEPPVVIRYNSKKNLRKRWVQDTFRFIMTWDDDLVDGVFFRKLQWTVNDFVINSSTFFVDDVNYNTKKLVTQISSNKKSSLMNQLYSLRKIINLSAESIFKGDLEYYGPGWSEKNKSYMGVSDNKAKTLNKYKFSFCIENMAETNGYITEKIFDIFREGVIPIYLGAKNIGDYIPYDTFIDFKNFHSLEHLYVKLTNINFEEYRIYQKKIYDFLNSNDAQVFTNSLFIKNIFRILNYLEIDQVKFEKLTILSILQIYFRFFIEVSFFLTKSFLYPIYKFTGINKFRNPSANR